MGQGQGERPGSASVTSPPTASGHTSARWDIALFVVLVVAALAALALFLARALGDPDLWFDEAGQYWLSRGQFHFSPAGTPDASVWSGLGHAQSGFNLDPPGFTVLLALWADAMGSAPPVLRALPAAAFMLTVVATTALGRSVFRLPLSIAFAIAIATVVTPLTLAFSVEVRAYSAEVLAVIVLALALLRYLGRPGRGRLAALIAVALVGLLFTRYSFSYAVAGLIATFLAGSWITGVRVPRRHWALLTATLGVCVLALGWFALSGAGTTAPAYVSDLVLLGAEPSALLRDTVHSLLVWPHIMTTLFLIVGTVCAVRWLRARPVSAERAPVVLALVFVAAYQAAAIAASTLGRSPWEGTTRWSIGLIPLAGLSAMALASMIKAALPRLSAAIRTVVTTVLTALAIVAAGAAMIVTAQFVPQQWPLYRSLNDGLAAAVQGRAGTQPGEVLVTSWLWPSYRYVVERSGEPVDVGWLGAREVDTGDVPAAVAAACRSDGLPTVLLSHAVGVQPALDAARSIAGAAWPQCAIDILRQGDVAVLRISPEPSAVTR